MRQSVELLLDPAAEAWVVGLWRTLAEAGLPSQAAHTGPSNRPHVTLCEVPTVTAEAEAALAARCRGLALDRTRLGEPRPLGDDRCAVVLPVDARDDLLALRRDLALLLDDRREPWSPHVTLARRVPRAQLPACLEVLASATGRDVGLGPVRRWDPSRRRTWTVPD